MKLKNSKVVAISLAVVAVVAIVIVSVMVAKGHNEKDSVGAENSNGTVSAVQNDDVEVVLGSNKFGMDMYGELLADGSVSASGSKAMSLPDYDDGLNASGDTGNVEEGGLPAGLDSHKDNMQPTDGEAVNLLSSENDDPADIPGGDGSGADGQNPDDSGDVENDGRNPDDAGNDGLNSDGTDITGDDSQNADGGDSQNVSDGDVHESLAGAVVGADDHIILDDILMDEQYSSNRKKYLEILGRIEDEYCETDEVKKFLPVYNQGTDDETVADIQDRLMQLGFMEYSEPTMHYGPATMEAVKLFQRQNDLKQDGIIGEQTIGLLFEPEAKSYLLKNGMDGNDIKSMQQRLYELGYLASKDQVSGHFGDETEKAVKALQTANKLTPDGKVGVMTNELMYSEDVKANLITLGDKNDIVMECQKRLKELGYLTTTPDGLYGADTQAAVKLFQSKNDCIVDGYIGPSTREALNSPSAVPNGLRLGDEGDTVKRVQELLIKYGYMNSGSATGYFGEVTEAAVKKFQSRNGLSADGNVGQKTMAVLTGSSVVKASTGNGGNGGNGGNDGGNGGNGGDGGKTGGGNDGGNGGSGETVVVSGASADALIQVAKSKLGCPYIYGSKGPNSFDCSGFVYWCLKQIGVNQSYLTSYQWRTVGKYKKVNSISDLKKGDIIVVYGHVGIAAGNNMVYDASSSSGKIVYRELGDWWKRNFICGWRIFD